MQENNVIDEETVTLAPGFVPGIHSKAMGMAPPRPVTAVSFSNAVDHWRGMLHALGAACRSLILCSCWSELRQFLTHFAAQNNAPLVRSILHRAISGPVRPIAGGENPTQQLRLPQLLDGGQAGHQLVSWTPSQSMFAAEFGWDAGNPPGPDAALFLDQCAIAVQGWCHTMCLNRCRQRRRLRRLSEDWRNMTDHAFNAEASKNVQAWFIENCWSWKPVDDTVFVPVCRSSHFSYYLFSFISLFH